MIGEKDVFGEFRFRVGGREVGFFFKGDFINVLFMFLLLFIMEVLLKENLLIVVIGGLFRVFLF